ncbi:uracil-DNA glycosylase [Roseobacter ponti]|uniref:Type-4 uracil-DNA glycosylase n=1 Tax=Roseobacter ponti TaxID=1891787 RepID=A0A858SXE1_9RHOB|nr:uracil-DNA glycosylase [Roseobacter ponti]QJF52303.1 uracil-DNA glycosylase [Roseobacter ponti]
MESAEFHYARALLEWQVELGATEAIGDMPVNCYELPDTMPGTAPKQAAPAAPGTRAGAAAGSPAAVAADPVAEAERAAMAATDLDGLRAALAGFEHCALKKGARNLVFSDGRPGAAVMIIGEAPGRDEDREGRPFVGAAGQLLDRMFAAIGLGRGPDDTPVYITNVLPWRPPQNRDPSPEEIAMMRPFLLRHIELSRPQVLVIMGNISAQALLGRRGITRLRGSWTEACGLPAMPMCHPAYLLRTPEAKRDAWADLLEIRARLTIA